MLRAGRFEGSEIGRIGVEHRRRAGPQQDAEQAQLGGAVILHRTVIVEMVARQVGEGAGGEGNPVETVLAETVARRFENQMVDAGPGEIGEVAVQRDRIGRGQRALHVMIRGVDAEGAEAGGPVAEVRPDLAREPGH